jgi:hypothetical protein
MLRPAYPDELGRARSLLDGHPVAPGARFLLWVNEQPVERIIAAIPWWKAAGEGHETELKFSIHSSSSTGLSDVGLDEALTALEGLAQEEKVRTITLDSPLVEGHPLFQKLTARGYQISQTDTFICAPGKEVKSLFLAQKNQLPADWHIESIRGCGPETFYPLVAADGSLTPKQFKAYWDGSNRERFEGEYSHLLLAGEEVIGLLLVTLHGTIGLNIRLEGISEEHAGQSELISNILHQAAFQNCPEGFPQVITWSRQTESSYQGGAPQPPRHTLQRSS